MKDIFYFGEKVKGFEVRVFNEREARAAAGILFLFAIISFLNVFLLRNFVPLKLFITSFLIDFSIRIFVNPKFSPTMILGRIAVSNQRVEYSGAPQKKFAWGLGLALAITMFFLVVIKNVTGPVNLAVCILCLTLLFFEAAFGICIGCKIYNLFNKEKAKLCPGGVCEIKIKEEVQKISLIQVLVVLLFVLFIVFIWNSSWF